MMGSLFSYLSICNSYQSFYIFTISSPENIYYSDHYHLFYNQAKHISRSEFNIMKCMNFVR